MLMRLCVRPFNVLGQRFKGQNHVLTLNGAPPPGAKGPSIDDKGSCSFRHLCFIVGRACCACGWPRMCVCT